MDLNTKENKKVEDGNNLDHQIYIFTLFIIGASANSSKAITNLKDILEARIKGKYNLEIIDVYQQPEIAELEQIIALPLLIKRAPMPVRRLIGDMSDTVRVLAGLGLNV